MKTLPLLCAALVGLAGCVSAQAPGAGGGAPVQPHGSAGAAAPASVRLSGAVQAPRTLDLAALKSLPVTRVELDGQRHAGVSLWALLNAQGGLAIPASPRNTALGYYVVATGSDGYQAVFSLAELDPGIGERPVLVAYELDGAPLDRSGMARLVVPGDKKRGRWVANLSGLEVRAAR